jgi:predicted acylesterase/phospholipase RssA
MYTNGMLGLVLGGGAAKGYAHIGAIRVLEEIGIKPHIVVGASMGALIGGFYAAGFDTAFMEGIARQIDKKKKNWLFKPHLSKKGFVTGKNVVKFLTPYLGNKRIEDLPKRYAVVATDVEHETEIIINRGDLIQAIRSAISIPVVFMPHNYYGRILIDGGFVNPLPITIAQRLGAKKIIAVNVLHRVPYNQEYASLASPSNKTYSMKKIFEKTFELITSRLLDYEIARMKKGVVIDINTRGIGMSQFEKAETAIDRGYATTQKYRKQIRRFLH